MRSVRVPVWRARGAWIPRAPLARRLTVRWCVAAVGACVCVAALGVLSCPPAWGLAQRGHVLAFSFGGAGEGDGEFRFDGPAKQHGFAGVAVDETSGDVYVVDQGNDRVQEFSPMLAADGAVVGEQFVAAFGWGVGDGAHRYEVCTSGCRAGVAGAGAGALRQPGPIAVDNSPWGGGVVYVGSNPAAKRPDVQRFAAGGEAALGRLADREEGSLDGLAVDGRGDVWVYRGVEEEAGVVEGFTGSKRPVRLEEEIGSPLECPKPGFAVDASGEDFYVAHELLDGLGVCPAVAEREAAAEGSRLEGALVRPAVVGKLNVAEVLASGTAALAELEREGTSGVAVDEASDARSPLGEAANGDVYVDDGGAVGVFDASGSRIQTLGAGELSDGMGVAVDSRTGDVFVVDGAEEKVQVFAPEAAGRPVVEYLRALDRSPSEVMLSGAVNPQGAETHYAFEYGTVDCATHPGGCVQVPAAPGASLPAGFGAQGVAQTLTGLEPGRRYFYRLIASNDPYGSSEAAESQATLQTLPSPAGVLADGRAWELVSPPEKDGAQVEGFPREGGLVQAAPDGEAVSYVADGPVGQAAVGARSPEPTQVLSVRSPDGWGSQDLQTPRVKGEGLEVGEPAEYRLFSEGLALAVVQPTGGNVEPFEVPPLAPGASEKTIYLRADPPLVPGEGEREGYALAQANSGFLAPGFDALLTPALVSGETAPGEKSRFGGRLAFLDATPDLAHVVLDSEVPLLSGSQPGLYETGLGGGFALVSVLPDGKPAVGAQLGDEDTLLRGALSKDGSRVIFTGEPVEEGAPQGLYLRDARLGQTVRLNAAQGVVEPAGEEEEVAFQGASADGSRVFFTDTAPLTALSGQRPRSEKGEADLYECVITQAAGKLACELSDITPVESGGSADVLNVLPALSEDGSTVYFIANGVLAAGAVQGHCTHQAQEVPPPGAECNLYRWQEGEITLIAVLCNEDSGDWGSLKGPGRVGGYAANRPDLADVTAGASPNGEFFAFMSQRPLVGYETTDAEDAGVHDEEVYLYDAQTRTLTCASCDSGGPPVGVHDTEHAGEGEGLLVDRRGDWAGEYLAGSLPGWDPLGLDGAVRQPRYLSNEGRLFFDSPDRLVPQAANGKQDVYEYEPSGVGDCEQQQGCVSLISAGSSEQESAFLEASETGDDAFFITAQPLVPADHDENYDVYDARVCTSASPCLASEASSQRRCETSASCNPTIGIPPSMQLPASAIYDGPGNAAHQQALGYSRQGSNGKAKAKPSREQQLKNALRACRKKNRHHRAACEAQARKRYTPKRTAKDGPPRSSSRTRR